MKPIIMSAESVRAILDGRKTQTRRVIKPQPLWIEVPTFINGKWVGAYSRDPNITNPTYEMACPYGQPGDRLWVRETWADMSNVSLDGERHATYKQFDGDKLDNIPWKSPIFMPRWASRITLEVTDVRAERLQDITHESILAEGWHSGLYEPLKARVVGANDARAWYIALWDAINARRGYAWDSNPWVWVVEFRRVE